MILEQRILPFSQWIGEAVSDWAFTIFILFLAVIFVSLAISAFKYGVFGSVRHCFFGTLKGIENFFLLSPRRTWAIARLTIKESIRRRVLFIGLVFLVILMFAGWYLDPNSSNPAKLYLSFVLSASSYLMLLLALFLSSFSLPTDFKTKTIYTVVTKPVRPSEMVLGRILGVTVVGTMILVLMGAMSYFFVSGTLSHTHLLTEQEDMTEVPLAPGMDPDNPKRVVLKGETRIANGHKHAVEILADGTAIVEMVTGHTHGIKGEKNAEQTTRYVVQPAVGMLQARVPIYGELLFRNQEGIDAYVGINVGYEWDYRSFIRGGGVGNDTSAAAGTDQEAAFWTFTGIYEKDFPDGVPLEMTLGVFRSTKGDIEKPIAASVALRNPKTGLFADVTTFRTEEFVTKSVFLERKFRPTFLEKIQRRHFTPQGEMVMVPPTSELEKDASFLNKKEIDIFEDIVSDGMFEVWLRCGDSKQYIGAARADLYIRASDAWVSWNFAKGFFGIWQQMVLITAYGVVLSTFLSGPVTMVATLGVMIAGFFKTLLLSIALLRELGGGPLEAFIRLMTHQNLVNDLAPGLSTTFVQGLDKTFGGFLALFGQMIPPLSEITIYYSALSSGFDIPTNWLLQNGLTTLAYLFPLYIIGYLILSSREVAK